MSIHISKSNTGWTFSFKKHILNTLGVSLIISGLATLSSPWWLGIAVALLKKTDFDVEDDNSMILGSLQILIGIVLILIKKFILDKITLKKSIDKETLLKSKIELSLLNIYFSQLLNDHSFTTGKDSLFYDSFTFFDKPENIFQYTKTKKLYDKYVVTAKSLHSFKKTFMFFLIVLG